MLQNDTWCCFPLICSQPQNLLGTVHWLSIMTVSCTVRGDVEVGEKGREKHRDDTHRYFCGAGILSEHLMLTSHLSMEWYVRVWNRTQHPQLNHLICETYVITNILKCCHTAIMFWQPFINATVYVPPKNLHLYEIFFSQMISNRGHFHGDNYNKLHVMFIKVEYIDTQSYIVNLRSNVSVVEDLLLFEVCQDLLWNNWWLHWADFDYFAILLI